MPPFRYCLNASTIRPTPLLDKIRIAAEAGYVAVELWHDELEAFVASGGTLASVRRHLSDAGLELATTIYLRNWFDSSGPAFEASWAECRRRMEAAAELGARYVIASPPAGEADYDRGAERYRQLLEFGDTLGVWPIMEFLGFVGHLNTIERALVVLEKCGHPRATTVLDPFHISRGGGSVESIRKLRADQVAISHFNDVPADPPPLTQRDPDRVYPGDGCFPLERYVALLREIGYSGWISLELFREDLWRQDPLHVARTGLEKMKKVVEAATSAS